MSPTRGRPDQHRHTAPPAGKPTKPCHTATAKPKPAAHSRQQQLPASERSSVPGAADAHLGRVVDELQGRIAGNHRAQIRERAGGVQPAVRAIHPGGVKETDHCGESEGGEASGLRQSSGRSEPRSAGSPSGSPDSRSLAKAALMTHWMKTRLSAYVNFSCRAPSPYFPRVLQERDAVSRRRGEKPESRAGPAPAHMLSCRMP